MKILLVKMSSMGDLVHNCPIVSDIRAHFPQAEIDWVAEEAYQAIPALHTGVRKVIPIAWRRWRSALWHPIVQEEIRLFRADLKADLYDLVLDTQGLLKSAFVASMARSGGVVGGDWRSIKEGAASLFYDKKLAIAKSLHVIERCRAVAAGALGYTLDSPAFYGIRAQALLADWLPTAPYAVLMHAASRAEKLWPETHWLALGQTLNDKGIAAIVPWGDAHEKARAERLASALPNALVPPLMTLDVAAGFLAGARVVIGLDTGFTHFAAALGRPTIGIFCDSDGEQAAVSGDGFCASFGKKGAPPELALIAEALEQALVAC